MTTTTIKIISGTQKDFIQHLEEQLKKAQKQQKEADKLVKDLEKQLSDAKAEEKKTPEPR